MLALPVFETAYNPEQPIVHPHPGDSDNGTDTASNVFPWPTETPQYPAGESMSFDSQFNSELLVRAAAAAYNCRSSYRQCQSSEQFQQHPRRSRSKARTCGAVIIQGSADGMVEFDPISNHLLLPVSVSEAGSLETSPTHCFGKAELFEDESFDNTEVTTSPSDNISTVNLQDEPDEPSKPLPLQKVDVVLVNNTDPPSTDALTSSTVMPSIAHAIAVTPLKPVMPLKIKLSESRNMKRHRPPPFNLEITSMASSPHFSQSQALTHTMVMSFAMKMTTNSDTQVEATVGSSSTLNGLVGQMPHALIGAQKQENLTQDIRDIESSSSKKGRQLWTKPSLLLKRRSSNKTDQSVGPTTSNSVNNLSNCSSPLGMPKSLKIANQSEFFLNSVTNETSDGVTDATTSAKVRRHMQSKSQDFTRVLHNSGGVGVSNGKSIRHVRSGASLRSSAKAISMPLPEISSPVLRSPANSTAPKASPSVDEISSKATLGWPTFLWRNPFQPSSPSQSSSESSELSKQRNSPEEPSSPSSPSSLYSSLRRKKSIHEKLFGKWGKKLPSFSSPLSSPRLSGSGTLEFAPCNRYSATSLSAYGSPATSPTFQYDHGQTRESHWHRHTNETRDSDYDRMNASPSRIRKKGNDSKPITPLEKRDSKIRDISRQDEIWKRILDIAMDDNSTRLTPENEEPYMRSKLEALWIDDGGDFDGDYEEGEDGDDCDEGDDDKFDFETGGYEITNSRKAEKESKSEAYICRVMEQWQLWSIAHAAII
ncbi:hypothetical protein BGX26_010148 [Mortierella sp. AD094]|nr:hypothetical protein BGX26_010148 [Mortierella sp. AD094]